MKRENANAIAGVEVPSSGHPEVVKVRDAIQSNTPNVVVPLFNVVDSGDTTQEVLSQEVAKVFGIQVSYSPETLTEDQYRGFIEVLKRGYNFHHPSFEAHFVCRESTATTTHIGSKSSATRILLF